MQSPSQTGRPTLPVQKPYEAFGLGGLHAVRVELDLSLTRARNQIEEYLEDPENPELLQIASRDLHQIRGTASIIQCFGVAALAEEMKQCALDLAQRHVADEDAALSALSAGVVQLGDYLDALLSGFDDCVLVLQPALNELRLARGRPVLTEQDLFIAQMHALALQLPMPAQAGGGAAQAEAARLLRYYQHAMVRWLRGEPPQRSVSTLGHIAETIAGEASEPRIYELWRVVAAGAEVLLTRELAENVEVKRLFGRAGMNLKVLAEDGEWEAQSRAGDLAYRLLFQIGRTRSRARRTLALRNAFQLSIYLPTSERVDRLRRHLRGPNTELLNRVAAEIRNDLAAIQDRVDLAVRSGTTAGSELNPIASRLRSVGAALQMLGLESLHQLIELRLKSLPQLLAEPTVKLADWMDFATDVLQVEQSLEDALFRQLGKGYRDLGDEPDGRPRMADWRHGVSAVMRESLINVAKIKDVVAQLLRDGDAHAIGDCPHLIGEVSAAIQFIGPQHAAGVFARLARFFDAEPLQGLRASASVTASFAEVVAAAEMYLEARRDGLPSTAQRLDELEARLALLETALDLPALELSADGSADFTGPEPVPAPAPAQTAGDEELDPAIREVFLEEADEVLQTLAATIPRWLRDSDDRDALVETRRAFHTLKGSGRMVGASAIGEFAWAIENLLNRCLDGTVGADADVFDTVRDALAALPGLIAGFRDNTAPSEETDALAQRAQRLASERRSAESIDLRAVFRQDAMDRLATIDAWLAGAPEGAALQVPNEVRRAFHTLRGAGPLVDAPHIGNLAGHVEDYLEELAGGDLPLPGGAPPLFRDIAQTLRNWVEQMSDKRSGGEDPGELIARVEALRNSVPESVVRSTADRQLAEIFAGEAFELVEDIEKKFKAWSQEPDATTLPREIVAQLHTLRGAALMSSAPQVAMVALALHQQLDGRSAMHPPQAFFDEALAIIEGLFQLLDDYHEGVRGGDGEPWLSRAAALDPSAGDASPDTAAEGPSEDGPAAPELPSALAEVAAAQDESIDEELREIFVAEATELLEQSEEWLARLARNAGDGDALTELRRAMHTFKGSARMAGFLALGDIAYTLEQRAESATRGHLAVDAEFVATFTAANNEQRRALGLPEVSLSADAPPPAPDAESPEFAGIDFDDVGTATAPGETSSADAPADRDAAPDETASTDATTERDAAPGETSSTDAPADRDAAPGDLESLPDAQPQPDAAADALGEPDAPVDLPMDGQGLEPVTDGDAASVAPEAADTSWTAQEHHAPEPEAPSEMAQDGELGASLQPDMPEPARWADDGEPAAPVVAANDGDAIQALDGDAAPAQVMEPLEVMLDGEPLPLEPEDGAQSAADPALESERFGEASPEADDALLQPELPTEAGDAVEGGAHEAPAAPPFVEPEAVHEHADAAPAADVGAAWGEPEAPMDHAADVGDEAQAWEPAPEPTPTASATEFASFENPHEAEAAAADADGAAPPADAASPFPADAPAPELDAELIEIFQSEAVELLEDLDRHARRWSTTVDDSHASGEVLRALHTLKGGARMAGLTRFGLVVHELETLLEETHAAGGHPDVQAFARLFAGIEQLNGMLDDVQRGELASLIAEPGTSGLAALAQDEGPFGEEAPPPPAPAAPVQPVEIDDAPLAAAPTVEAAGDAPAWNPELFWAPDLDTAASAARRETARVSVERLDSMLNEAGEMSICRSRLEQHNLNLQQMLHDTAQTIERLRGQLRMLDIETEAQIAARGLSSAGTVTQDRYESEFDALEMDRYTRMQELSRALAESLGDLSALHLGMDQIAGDAELLLQQQGRINTEVQTGLMGTLMVPFARQTQRLQRVVRQTAQENGRQVELSVDGEDAELDRNVLERMTAPLEHLLRNAVVHGIEAPEQRVELGKPAEGHIRIALRREGTQLLISLQDDGRGFDVGAIRETAIKRGLMPADSALSDDEVIQFIFAPGFSTARQLTQDAGRGIGMDVVASEIKQLGGLLEIGSEAGRGARFLIRLPLTLAIAQSLLVAIGDEQYALPLTSVEGIVRLPREQLADYARADGPSLHYGGQDYPVRSLGDFIGVTPNPPQDSRTLPAILIRIGEGLGAGAGERRIAVVVDQLLGNRQIVSKAVGQQASSVSGLSGATILADGRVVLILDVSALVQDRARRDLVMHSAQAASEQIPQPSEPAAPARNTVMVVDDSITMRRVAERLLARNGFEVITAKDGLDAMAMLQTESPAAILLDIEMPRADGFEVAAFVRNSERISRVPIIMITSRSGDKHRERARQLGVNRYLIKPYQEDELMSELRSVLAEAAA